MKPLLKLALILTCVGVARGQGCINLTPTASPNIGLYVIATNACNWGTYTNDNMGFLDSFLSGGLGVPRLWFPTTTTPTNPSSGLKLWVDSSDGLFHTLNSAGVNSVLGSGGGGSGNTTSTALVSGNLPVANGANSLIDSTLSASNILTLSGTQTVTGNKTFTGTVTLPASQVVNGVTLSSTGSTSLFLNQAGGYTSPGGSGMVYPGAGIPLSTGSAWGSSYSTTGSGNVVLSTSATLITPALGTPTALVLTNATGLPGGQITGANSIPASTLPLATTGAFGAVKPDGSTITITAGVISSTGGGGISFGAGVPVSNCTPGTSGLYQDTAATNVGTALYSCTSTNVWSPLFTIDTSTGSTYGTSPTNGLPQIGNNPAAVALYTSSTPFTGVQTFANGLKVHVFITSTLPTCSSGAEGLLLAVSDATTPTYNGVYTGGSTVHVPVYCDGTSWKTH